MNLIYTFKVLKIPAHLTTPQGHLKLENNWNKLKKFIKRNFRTLIDITVLAYCIHNQWTKVKKNTNTTYKGIKGLRSLGLLESGGLTARRVECNKDRRAGGSRRVSHARAQHTDAPSTLPATYTTRPKTVIVLKVV